MLGPMTAAPPAPQPSTPAPAAGGADGRSGATWSRRLSGPLLLVAYLTILQIASGTLDGWTQLGGPFVVARALIPGQGTIVDHGPILFVLLESCAWLVGIAALARSELGCRWFAAAVFSHAYYQGTTWPMMLGSPEVVWLLHATLLALAAFALWSRARPGRVATLRRAAVLVLAGFVPAGIFLFLGYASARYTPAAALLVPVGSLAMVGWLVLASRRPSVAEWTPAAAYLGLLLAMVLVAGRLLDTGRTPEVPSDEMQAHCAQVRADAPPAVRWDGQVPDAPYALLPLSDRRDHLLLVGQWGELWRVSVTGPSLSPEGLPWSRWCDRCEAVATTEAHSLGVAGCTEHQALFDPGSPYETSVRPDWPAAGQEPLDVRWFGDGARLWSTVSLQPGAEIAVREGNDLISTALHNYRGRAGVMLRTLGRQGAEPRFAVSTYGLHRLDPSTLELETVHRGQADVYFGGMDDGDRVVLLGIRTGDVEAVDPKTGDLLAATTVPDGPRYVERVGERYVVSPYFGDELQVLDRETLRSVGVLPVGPRPRNLVWLPDSRRLLGISLCGLFSIDEAAIP